MQRLPPDAAMLSLGLLLLNGLLETSCAPTPTRTSVGTALEILDRTWTTIGAASGKLIHFRYAAHTSQPYQSDRTYPPFFSMYETSESWFDPATGAERTHRLDGAYPRSELPPSQKIGGRGAEWFVRDTLTRAFPDFSFGAVSRPLDPWAVVADFRAGRDVVVKGVCSFRDYPRLALERRGPLGVERLLIDPKTGFPVALVRTEPHYLWGQVDVAYVWSNWSGVEPGGFFPTTAFRLVDGEVDVSRTVTVLRWAPADSAPRMTLPDPSLSLPAGNGAFGPSATPDTIRVDEHTWLLRNPFYTIAVTKLRDTIFVLDATLGEIRGRQDSTWIARLFPGRFPIVLVVTDLAWPHIAGMRYWVANGARVVSHRGSEAFLRRVYERRWTTAPDLLERRRAISRFQFQGVVDRVSLAGGDLQLVPIDGISSEVALMGWLPRSSFLWAGDYIQDVRAPSQYAREVKAAVERAGAKPSRFAAQHVSLTDWRVIDSLHAAPAVP